MTGDIVIANEHALSREDKGRGDDGGYRHCERSEAIQKASGITAPWIATACGLAMTLRV